MFKKKYSTIILELLSRSLTTCCYEAFPFSPPQLCWVCKLFHYVVDTSLTPGTTVFQHTFCWSWSSMWVKLKWKSRNRVQAIIACNPHRRICFEWTRQQKNHAFLHLEQLTSAEVGQRGADLSTVGVVWNVMAGGVSSIVVFPGWTLKQRQVGAWVGVAT